MSQEIKEIDIKNLVLWTENPRDPIDPLSNDQDIANKAWSNEPEKWNLMDLAKEMQLHYDLSELPTVVYHQNRPIVYDGNRRMILAKLKHNHINLDGFDKSKLPDIPIKIPCNVCSKEIAIQNIFRKHGKSGTWTPLNRDLFIHYFMKGEKSAFLKLEEATKIISSNPHLNQVFVKDEIFTNEKLKSLGFLVEDSNLKSKYNETESMSILSDISKSVKSKKITTRKNRGSILEVLSAENRQLVDSYSTMPLKNVEISFSEPLGSSEIPTKKLTPRTKNQSPELFNGTLYLKKGEVSDLYRDITDLYSHYLKCKDEFSQHFPCLIRMSMRLLTEAAAMSESLALDAYIKKYFNSAKTKLDEDAKTTLYTQNVNLNTITQLLQIGAHNYTAGRNLQQTIALSIILGKILEISHGK